MQGVGMSALAKFAADPFENVHSSTLYRNASQILFREMRFHLCSSIAEQMTNPPAVKPQPAVKLQSRGTPFDTQLRHSGHLHAVIVRDGQI